MSEAELRWIDERVRQILRRVSELEEKYSVRGFRLLGDPVTARTLASGSEEARRDIKLLRDLYVELIRLRELRSSYPGSTGAAERPRGHSIPT